jgi:hypothetical protein
MYEKFVMDFLGLKRQAAFIYTPPPRVATVPNAAVQHGPIALPNLLCAPSASHKSFVRTIGQLTRS